jgi:hypothetical protein
MMMGCRMVLCKVVAVVVFAWFPVDSELILLRGAANPIKTHVHGLGPSLFDGVVGDTAGGRVVVFHRCGRLWVTHVDEGLTEGQTSCSL